MGIYYISFAMITLYGYTNQPCIHAVGRTFAVEFLFFRSEVEENSKTKNLYRFRWVVLFWLAVAVIATCCISVAFHMAFCGYAPLSLSW